MSQVHGHSFTAPEYQNHMTVNFTNTNYQEVTLKLEHKHSGREGVKLNMCVWVGWWCSCCVKLLQPHQNTNTL